MMVWTEEKKNTVARYLKDGLSAAQIGALFGVTRNSIIGLVERNSHLSDIGFVRNPGDPRHLRPKVTKLVAPKRAGTSNVIQLLFEKDGSVKGKPLDKLEARECRWAVNEADVGQTHLFCGHATGLGQRYCPDHMRLSSISRAPLRISA